jgi:hypothetical protein
MQPVRGKCANHSERKARRKLNGIRLCWECHAEAIEHSADLAEMLNFTDQAHGKPEDEGVSNEADIHGQH